MDETPTQALGRWGEDLAAQHVEAAGMTVLHRNWRCPVGELDIVARDSDGTLVFIEVKTRSGVGYGDPVEAISRKKSLKLRQLSCEWLAQSRPSGSTELRFDVIGIVRRPGLPPIVTHLRGAF